MTVEHRPLLMRANRLLGAQLVEHNLVRIEDLEAANERLLELINGGSSRQCSLLGILAFETKVVREEDILTHLADNEGLGLVDLRHYEIHEELKKKLDPGACWASWSVPFDQEEDVVFIATAYYLSPPVRAYWEKQFTGRILWYGTTLEGIADLLEGIQEERTRAAAGAAVIATS